MSKKNPALWIMGAVALLAIIIVVGLGQTEEDNLFFSYNQELLLILYLLGIFSYNLSLLYS